MSGNEQESGAQLRPDLPPLPDLMLDLPIDSRGYPVPWFVHYARGVPNFRVVDGWKLRRAIDNKLCWICGKDMRSEYCSFIAGPMIAVTRTCVEPPSHGECALYAAMACPYLCDSAADRAALDARVRGRTRLPAPGIVVIYTSADYKAVDGPHGLIFEVGEPSGVLWMRQGLPATRREAIDALAVGLPGLQELAEGGAAAAALPGDAADLRRRYYAALVLLPNE